MALVNVVSVNFIENPTSYSNPFRFEITFECIQELEDDLEWKILYVGSAKDAQKDQILDEILVGPVPVGMNKFILEADAPDYKKLPPDDVLGVTVVLVTCSYKEREFVRIGYYVNNEYNDGVNTYDNEDNVPPSPTSSNFNIEHVQRTVLADQPRVTRFPIPWSTSNDVMVDTTNINYDEITSSNFSFHEVDQAEIEQVMLENGYDITDTNEEEFIDEDIADDDDDEEEDDDDNIEDLLEEDISYETDNPNSRLSNKHMGDMTSLSSPVILNDTELE